MKIKKFFMKRFWGLSTFYGGLEFSFKGWSFTILLMRFWSNGDYCFRIHFGLSIYRDYLRLELGLVRFDFRREVENGYNRI